MNGTITATFDVAPHILALTIETDGDDRELSGLILTLHLPKAADPSRTRVNSTPRLPTDVTVLYDGAFPVVGYDLELTSGSTDLPMRISAVLNAGGAKAAYGDTASPISDTLSLEPPPGGTP